jgi:D-tyrosyl-tRNA(Tyr) deacylase
MEMIALIQRVTEASVAVAGEVRGSIGPGLLVLLAVQPDDDPAKVSKMAKKVLNYRVFADFDGKMNESLLDQALQLLVVPQFTLAADTRKGARPSFTSAASPEKGNAYFEMFVTECGSRLQGIEKGVFGANMQVSLVNDGPVTFWLEA